MSYIRNSKEVKLQHSRDCPSQLVPRGRIIPQPVAPVLSWSCKGRPGDEEASLPWKHLLDGSGKEWDKLHRGKGSSDIDHSEQSRFILICTDFSSQGWGILWRCVSAKLKILIWNNLFTQLWQQICGYSYQLQAGICLGYVGSNINTAFSRNLFL